ncbi:MAG: glycosyltransferase family 2 protein [Dinoroseobacter sp.]|nr:glycosyltransferase family 2 protein [Dinoroseobacter sp.]
MNHALREAYRLRWKRRELMWRAWRKRRELVPQFAAAPRLPEHGVLCFACVRNESERLPFWLAHYRALGVTHFLIVDNASTDETPDLLGKEADVSLWSTKTSYKAARFGMDWLMVLLARFGQNRWCLTVDADELLVYPDSTSRPLAELTDTLDRKSIRSFGALMVELFPKGPMSAVNYQPGQDPTEVLRYLDPGPYRTTSQPSLRATLYQGGVRDRVFFEAEPRRAPTLNKIPLVRWHWRWAYLNSTHSLLPRYLNAVFSTPKQPLLSGALLHTKFLPSVAARAKEEKTRREHFGNSTLFDDYYDKLSTGPDLWYSGAVSYGGPEQLEALGFMARDPDW